MTFRWYYHHYQCKVTVSLSSTIETSMTLSALSYWHVHKETKCGLLFSPREKKGTERDSEGVGWDMLIPQTFERKTVSRDVCINTISLVFSKSFSSTKGNTTWSAITSKILNGSSNDRSRLPLCGRPEKRLPFQMVV